MEINNLEELSNELFCLNFEMQAMSDLLIRHEAERWVYKFMTQEIEQEHLQRYKYALNYINNKTVLDIACGSGYGSYFLAKNGNPKHIVGVDISKDSIRYANHRYSHQNIERVVANAEVYSRSNYFDTVLSFETIEHLVDFESFLKNVYTSLIKGGKLLISTPIVPSTQLVCNNPYHVIEWSFADFHNVINKYFDIEKIYVQNIVLKTDIPKPGIINRLFRRLIKPRKVIRSSFEKFEGQYNINQIIEGYQLLVCCKKN